MTLKEVMDTLIGFEISESESNQYVTNTILQIGVLFSNEARTVKSHIDFARALHDKYIESIALVPGRELTGLSAIPLFRNETFHIMLADTHY